MEFTLKASELGVSSVKFTLHFTNDDLLLFKLTLLLLQYKLTHFMLCLLLLSLLHEVILHFFILLELSLVNNQDLVLVFELYILLFESLVLIT